MSFICVNLPNLCNLCAIKTTKRLKRNEMKTLSIVNGRFQQNVLFRLYKHYIIDSILIVKREGFKALLRRRGKKFLFAILAYYLVRDTVIYIILPYCIARGIF